jgi:hypothetical protein
MRNFLLNLNRGIIQNLTRWCELCISFRQPHTFYTRFLVMKYKSLQPSIWFCRLQKKNRNIDFGAIIDDFIKYNNTELFDLFYDLDHKLDGLRN